MNRIRKGDRVIVIAGKSKGHVGTVIRVVDKGERVYVENANMVKRHTRPNPQANEPGGIKEQEAPIHISNVMLYNPTTKKGDRVGYRVLETGKKVRVFRSTNEVVDA